MKYFIWALVAWMLCGIISVGGMQARNNVKYKILMKNEAECREMLYGQTVVCVLTGPIGLVMTTAMTGGFAYGWTLSTPCDLEVK
jgi:hypothetical protein